MATPDDKRIDVLLVCSSGGHFLQLWWLSRDWRDLSRAWATLRNPDTESLLANQRTYFLHGPTERNVPNLARNVLVAWRLVRALRPRAIVSTGAAVAIPFAWVGWIFRIPVVYVESLARVDSPSVSCRLIRPVASRIYVQWPQLLETLPKARYAGTIFGEL